MINPVYLWCSSRPLKVCCIARFGIVRSVIENTQSNYKEVDMFFAMFTLIIFTFAVGLFALRTGHLALKQGKIDIRYFELMKGYEVPDEAVRRVRCFNNLLEVPIIFYLAILMYSVEGIKSDLAEILAWIYVILRFAQAGIHLTTNNIYMRTVAFWFSNFVVIALWCILAANKI